MDRFDLLNESIKEIRCDVKQILQDVAALKIRAGAWGVIGGIISGTALLVISIFGGLR